METMTARDRFHAVMNFRPFDRLPIVEWAPWWDKTIERWRTEGLPPELENYEINRHFGTEVYRQCWARATSPECPEPAYHGAGIIADEAGYEQVLDRLYPWDAVRDQWWKDAAAAQSRGDEVVWLTLDGFFWTARELLGIERHLYAFYDQPELLHRINRDLAAYHLRVIEEACRFATPDFMTFAEDMSYNHGSMLSKAFFDEYMCPYYRTVVPRLKELGIIALIDSDGDVTTPARWFSQAGLDGILPLERRSGVDVCAMRREHPRMRLVGGFDKTVMSKGEAAIRAECERLRPAAAAGGFVVGCDHQTPPEVSYEDYRLFLRLMREYAETIGEASRQ